MNKKIDLIVDYLIKRGNAKPRKVETLSNSINSIYAKSLNNNQLDAIIKLWLKKSLLLLMELK